MYCTESIDSESDTLINCAFAADKTLRLTRCNILHAEESQEIILATMSVSRYTHYLPKCIILDIYTRVVI